MARFSSPDPAENYISRSMGRVGCESRRSGFDLLRKLLISNHSSVIHRADYHEVMLNEAERLGVQIRLGCNVESLDFEQTEVVVEGGKRLKADVIVGADGTYIHDVTE
jgi:2-polyprenyl-6-methoxyphenol hydroxylase-like FAD-dependent oxidoreductase